MSNFGLSSIYSPCRLIISTRKNNWSENCSKKEEEHEQEEEEDWTVNYSFLKNKLRS
jgi:hypothetical protein